MARWQAGRLRRALAVALVAGCGAACSLVTSFDGLTTPGVSIDAGGVDSASPGAIDSGSVHPEGDATGSGGDASDGGTRADASDASDAAPDGSYCASLSPQPLFCDDFDQNPLDPAALAAPWDQLTGIGGSVERQGGIVTSAPLAMLVTSTKGVAIDLCGYKSFQTAPKTGRFTLAFDLYIVQADTTAGTSDAVLAAIELLDSSGSRWALQLEVSHNAVTSALDVNFSENESFGKDAATTYTGHPASAPLPIGAWTHVTMVATLGTSDVASLSLGTSEVAKPTITPSAKGGYPEILVGGTFAEKSQQGWTLRYDNVTFNVQ